MLFHITKRIIVCNPAPFFQADDRKYLSLIWLKMDIVPILLSNCQAKAKFVIFLFVVNLHDSIF